MNLHGLPPEGSPRDDDDESCTGLLHRLRWRPAAELRGTIAAAILDQRAARGSLGDITLLPHQREAVVRLERRLARHGGALLADDVGLGKTYVALAIAAGRARPLVVGPAALRHTWQSAMHRTRIRVRYESYESLSRAGVGEPGHDLVILDEAHHARNPGTRRYQAIVQLTSAAKVLLLSATPMHNSARDLRALLALFLGSAAHEMEERQLVQHVIRREHADVADHIMLPALHTADWLATGDDEDLLESILDLPPPVPPRGGQAGGVLLAVTLARLWASSRAALACALKRRLARATALDEALSDGRYPTAAELSAWRGDADAVQLGFPSLLVEQQTESAEGAALLRTLREHAAAVRELLERVLRDRKADLERFRLLATLHERHKGERLIAFTAFSDTADAAYRALRASGGVCVVTATGARVAGGRLTRDEALDAFAPGAAGHGRPADAIDLLITTDLASEGIDLQAASVVVHLDLPWTAARLEQRVGRVRRIGAPHERTWSYAFAPPGGVARWLRVEERLRAKLEQAGHLIGAERLLLPHAVSPVSREAAARSTERLHATLRPWMTVQDTLPLEGDARRMVSAVEADTDGWLALVRGSTGHHLVACVNDTITDDAARLADVAAGTRGEIAEVDPVRVRRALGQLHRWRQECEVRARTGIDDEALLRVRAPLLRRIASTLSHVPLARRATTFAIAARAREVALRRFTLAEERALLELCAHHPSDEQWLDTVAAFGGSRPAEPPYSCRPSAVELALLLLIGRTASRAPGEGREAGTPMPTPAP